MSGTVLICAIPFYFVECGQIVSCNREIMNDEAPSKPGLNTCCSCSEMLPKVDRSQGWCIGVGILKRLVW